MPDYMFLLESRLSPEQRAVLLRVQELARAQELNVYLSGGAVRDLISGMPIRDLDFTVEGTPFRMVRELEKGGARVLFEDERLRHAEMIFAGDVDGSIAAARDDYYERPGARPEIRWSTAMEDLRRRDFSINAIAISLNPASRGLLLDPTNGLADLERHEVRALSIHAFTNQPIRLLRVIRYCVRMGFKMETRTQEWFELALSRGLHENLEGAAVGQEVRQLGREDNPAGVLKHWEQNGLIGAVHPHLVKRHADYDGLARLMRARDALLGGGIRPRLWIPVLYYVLRRLKGREASNALRNMSLPASDVASFERLVPETEKTLRMLKGPKTKAARDAYFYLSEVPSELVAFLMAEYPNPKAVSKIRAYLRKWRPLRAGLPVGELDALGVPRGPKFDQILENFFDLELRGRGRTLEERTRLLKKLAGIKEEPKKPPKAEKKKKGKVVRALAPSAELAPLATAGEAQPAAKKAAAAASFSKEAGKGRPPGLPKHTGSSRGARKKRARR